MDRRTFLTIGLGTLAAPLTTEAQPARKVTQSACSSRSPGRQMQLTSTPSDKVYENWATSRGKTSSSSIDPTYVDEVLL
jgi:hypothetical protein